MEYTAVCGPVEKYFAVMKVQETMVHAFDTFSTW